MCGGIIPAHAGCTGRTNGAGLRGRDHPRSRGVHPSASRTVTVFLGSSPLTRGAHEAVGLGPAAGRIIPAHAGCTSTSALSRALRAGSSPLTRGARLPGGTGGVAGRIIPAHAGCTSGEQHPPARSRDHPRSRGVHASVSLSVGVLSWIIPAHAGCTARRRGCRATCADHPRSRGVHTDTAIGWAIRRGSSPLTRGAPPLRAERPPPFRIIPAHAGCTSPSGSSPRWQKDHPRSRGVHKDADKLVDENVWIIPAHAGCTGRSGDTARSPADHPRSRGVHGAVAQAAMIRQGSSPLTRGARRTVKPQKAGTGIIPAHAGCTEGRPR